MPNHADTLEALAAEGWRTHYDDPAGDVTALDTGGANRIRTALPQVIINLLDPGQSPDVATEASRVHF